MTQQQTTITAEKPPFFQITDKISGRIVCYTERPNMYPEEKGYIHTPVNRLVALTIRQPNGRKIKKEKK